MGRKKVVPIKGVESAPDVITQSDLKACEDLQAALWAAERATCKATDELVRRIALGASMEDGPLAFDVEVKKVIRRGCDAD